MVRNRPAPIEDPATFYSAPAIMKVGDSEFGLPPKAHTVGEMSTLPVKNTFVDFNTSAQELDSNGLRTAPGKFVGRLAGANFVGSIGSQGLTTAPNTPAGLGRPGVSMISGEGTTRTIRPAEVLSVSVDTFVGTGSMAVGSAFGAPPPPMHSPHMPKTSTDIAGLPPTQPPQVKPMQVSLFSTIAPPAPEALAAVHALAPPVMAPPAMPPVTQQVMRPVMAPPAVPPGQQFPTGMRQQLDAGSFIEVKPLKAGAPPGHLPRFAPPSYAMGYNLQTPVGANPPTAPPMFTPTCAPPMFAPSCSTPSGSKANGLLPPVNSGYYASTIPPTPSGSAWPSTPCGF